MHKTMGGISLRSLDTLSGYERDKYLAELEKITSDSPVTWYADNYTHRFKRTRIQVDNPNYIMMNTTVCALGVGEISREQLLLQPEDVVVSPEATRNNELLHRLARDCSLSVKDYDGSDTLARRYQVTNWPPKPDPTKLPLHLQREFVVLSLLYD